jgi:hypothetical protein
MHGAMALIASFPRTTLPLPLLKWAQWSKLRARGYYAIFCGKFDQKIGRNRINSFLLQDCARRR